MQFVFTERVPFMPHEICVTTGLSVNGRLCIAPREHLDSLVSQAIVGQTKISPDIRFPIA